MTILHDVLLGLRYLLGITVAVFFLLMIICLIRGVIRGLRRK